MSSRGILYVYWGDDHRALLERSMASVRQHHPELPIHVEKLADDATLLDKARMHEFTPFDETLFLDIDTVVLGRLDFAFAKAARFGLACAICECPWARRYRGVSGDMIEYNTGVLFFNRAARPLFDAWKQRAPQVDSAISHVVDGRVVRMTENDQAGFAHAVEETGFSPFVLPMNWNFRPQWQLSFFGPIRIWHDYKDVPQPIIEMNRDYEREDALIQYVSFGR